MLKVKDVRVVTKEKKDGSGTYSIIEIEFPNGYVYQSRNNKGYLTPDALFAINQNNNG